MINGRGAVLKTVLFFNTLEGTRSQQQLQQQCSNAETPSCIEEDDNQHISSFGDPFINIIPFNLLE